MLIASLPSSCLKVPSRKYLKGLFTNFEYITFFSCPTERNIFYERFISIKPLWLEIIEKKGCTKSVRVIYMIYITVLGRTDFVHPIFSIISSQSGFIEMNLLWKMFLSVGHEKMLYIQNWWTIPLRVYETFFSITSSQTCFIEMDLSWKTFLLLGHEKNVIYSKLVINPI